MERQSNRISSTSVPRKNTTHLRSNSFTIYDLGSSRAVRGIWQSKCERDVVKPCADAVTKKREMAKCRLCTP